MSDKDQLVIPVKAVRDGVNKDPEFAIAARFWNARIRFYSNEADEYFMEIRDGRVVDFQQGSDGYKSSTIYVGGPRETWRDILKPAPARFCNDFFPAAIHRGMRLGGDLSSLYAYYSALQRILAVMRQEINGVKA
ncbi:hypothetical protein EN962_20190 [Mesorhizobium sp. M7A.F.Ca.CA.001.09.2.1]|uniref:SCP2 domain-containing protein n=1 Tax=Mesorhizobium ciceri TaxID=39645 RepID=A0AB38TIC5_9HYPH|nr:MULTISPECIES: hypothetical protein [Mesorhizobium]RUU24552.1 hypothetical protein EOD10_01180 [Mesorhizobium sp. M7A.T.Ca.TU.009.01.3.2]RUY58996.1 hypothetical protein EN981_02025 [Mesorhizobium sp. M7A.F.Ca.CA.001.13.2.1]RVB43923.1 hypothetical protein EN918_06530 [Mesorhizobium sp. M7A.F.Ca.CA.004.05.1.1]MCF6121734.1 hypothetical protein [Mesorhizobium ciceri]MCQ8812315.1 hypothetical protein [Mesorhizobium sp. SEMIA396]